MTLTGGERILRQDIYDTEMVMTHSVGIGIANPACPGWRLPPLQPVNKTVKLPR